MGLIERIQVRVSDPNLRVDMSKQRPLFPPVTAAALEDAEGQLGFKLPALLRSLYLEVGNGGFGPGYGITGINEDGFVDGYLGAPLPVAYLAVRPEFHISSLDLPEHVDICHWGCCITSAIDLATPNAEMIFFDEEDFREGIGFEQWMEDWVNGVDLFKRGSNLKFSRSSQP